MITLLSPAKTLDFETEVPFNLESEIDFAKQSNVIAKAMKKLSRKRIGDLMKLSSNLADVNFQRYQMWENEPTKECTKQAMYMFKGDVYVGLDAYSLTQEQVQFAQNNVRMLSGMYGILKPLDRVQAYRLEMGTKMPVGKHKNLYGYWGNSLAEHIQKELKTHKEEVIVNLASNEYFKAVAKKAIQVPVITPVFKDFKNGQYKVISFFAKKARGTMARWIIQNGVEDSARLKEFDADGYMYSESESSDTEIVFLRS